jgi:hypothetical protein
MLVCKSDQYQKDTRSASSSPESTDMTDKPGAPPPDDNDSRPVLRRPDGKLMPGTAPANPTGLTRQGTAAHALVSAAAPKIIKTLLKLLDSENEVVQATAGKILLGKLLPDAPRPRSDSPGLSVQINNVAGDGGRAQTLALITLARLHREGRITAAELAAARGGPATLTALPAPEPIEATVTEIDPDEEDDAAA